ncbi:MAG TPA: nuclear transport factor 2 family protein [Flavipsychrobacter sp.]|nr:nuclear transport factor 2 family protein [Flavipsychrobacter sp.]
MIYQSTIFICIAILCGCANKQIDTKAEGEKLMQISREWSKSASTNDIEKTVSYWADDAIMMSNGQPTLKGKKAIREMVEHSSKIPGFKISWEPVSVSVSDDGSMAYMIEKNQITTNDSTGKPVTKYGTGVTIWTKDANGHWENKVEMMNDAPVQNK